MASISVFVRIRPMLQAQEETHQEKQKRFTIQPNRNQISVQLSDRRQKVFNFNHIFDEKTTQNQLYQGLGLSQLVSKVLDGYHSTIFAYGQTGSGKTYTIEGPDQNPGLILQVFDEIFNQIQSKNNNQRYYKIMLSFVQIYKEGIYDLIDHNGKALRMRWNKHQQFIVENLFQVQCRNQNDALKWWKKGQKNKIMGSHKMNINSSRSHCLLTLKIISCDLEDPSNIIQSKFEIVDLAGSERQKVTKSTGVVFREGIEINKSLFTLRQVITALYQISQGENNNKHIPYRDSKLTSLLKQSIGGNTYCTMIACLNPTSTHFQQSLQTLTYASMASFINNIPSRNIDPKIRQNEQLRQQNEQYRKQIKKMGEHIEELTKMLENNQCMMCKNSNNNNNALLKAKTQNNVNLSEQQSQPTGLKLPRFQCKTYNSFPNENSQKSISGQIQQNHKLNQSQKPSISNNITTSVATQKKSLKTNKDILQSITMIKQLINANSGLRQKIEILKQVKDRNQKQIYNLMKQNQVLRDRWDMLNDAFGQNENIKQENEVPIVAYERMVQQEQGMTGNSFYRHQKINHLFLSSEQKQKNHSRQKNSTLIKQKNFQLSQEDINNSSKPNSYNQFLKLTAKNSERHSKKKKNLSMYHRKAGKSDYILNC